MIRCCYIKTKQFALLKSVYLKATQNVKLLNDFIKGFN